MKWLIYALIVYVVWLYIQRAERRRAGPSPASDSVSRTRAGAESMVRCHYCDLAVPLNEALLANGQHYCSAAHRKLAAGVSASARNSSP